MTTFNEGQKVEIAPLSEMFGVWRKAKIAHLVKSNDAGTISWYDVEFPDGKHAVFDAEHIRPLQWTPESARARVNGTFGT
jgi:hypothetical protein